MTAAWIGLDFGTTSAKALALDEHGAVVARATVPYAIDHDQSGHAEQEPTDYIVATAELVRQCASGHEVRAIGLSGHTPSLVFVDADGAAVRPVLMWQDTRASEQAARLADAFGPPEALFGTNLAWAPANAPAKLAWVADHQPEVVAATRWVLQPKDYVGMWLTGEPVSDPWSTKGLCNVATCEPVSELLGQIGWDSRVMPSLNAGWNTRGGVSDAHAAELTVRPGTPVTVGWSDAMAGMLAVGVFDEPRAFDLSGSSDIVGVSTEQTTPVEGLFVIPETCAPLAVRYGPTQSSGMAIQWFASMFGIELDDVVAMASERMTSRPPVFVPYLAGERAPIWRSDVRACFADVRLEHGPADLAAAVLLGVAASVRDVIEAAEVGTRHRAAMVSLGGPVTRDEASIRSRAAMIGRPVVVQPERDTSALGAAMLAAAMTDGGLEAVGVRFPNASDHHHPRKEDKAMADDYYRRYRAAVEGVMMWTDRDL